MSSLQKLLANKRATKATKQCNERFKEATAKRNEKSDVAHSDAIFMNGFSDYIEKEKKKKKTEEKKKGKEKEDTPSEPKLAIDSWLGSKNLLELKEILYEAINVAKDVASSSHAEKMVRDFLKDIGERDLFNIVFIVVAYAWERYEDMSENEGACLSLLERINEMAQIVIGLESKEREEKDVVVKDTIAWMIKNCFAFRAREERLKLEKLKSEVEEKLIEQNLKYPCRDWKEHSYAVGETELKRVHRECSKDAVGIEDPSKEVIGLLEMGSDKKALAVVVLGPSATGKSILAAAVFAELSEKKTEGFNFYFVELSKREIRSYLGGQKQIGKMVEKENTFIYVDNVYTCEQGQDALRRLLPENMANAKKLRLLITTRDTDVSERMTMCEGVEKKFYPIKSLPEAKAVELLKKKLHDNGNQLDARQIDGIVKISGGVPGLLNVFAGFINDPAGKAVENYETLMEEAKEKNWKGDTGEKIEQFVFAYDKLEEDLKKAFLYLCAISPGWDWKTLSAVVGPSALQRLETRALITRYAKSSTRVRVPDFMLEVGLTKLLTKPNRFKMTDSNI